MTSVVQKATNFMLCMVHLTKDLKELHFGKLMKLGTYPSAYVDIRTICSDFG